MMDARATDQLVKLLGMLGSAHAGEGANAAAAADKLLRENGLTWREWIEERRRGEKPAGRSPKDVLELCLGCPEVHTAWERNFLADLRRRGPGLSEKQIAKLKQIFGRVEKYRGFAGV